MNRYMTAAALAGALMTSTPALACGSLQDGGCGVKSIRYTSVSTVETVRTWFNGTVLGYATRLVTQSPPPPRPATIQTARTGFTLGTVIFKYDPTDKKWWSFAQINPRQVQRVTGPDRAMLHGYTDGNGNNWTPDGISLNRNWTHTGCHDHGTC